MLQNEVILPIEVLLDSHWELQLSNPEKRSKICYQKVGWLRACTETVGGSSTEGRMV